MILQRLTWLVGRLRERNEVYVESKDQIIEKRADSRERVTLGSEVADKEVQLAVLEVDGDD